jgi:hypothetical protein
MSTISYNDPNFLSKNTFIPHKDGNAMNYGLNSFGCESIISYNNDIWKFLYFLNGSNKAVYINKNGLELILDPNTINDNKPIRMQTA